MLLFLIILLLYKNATCLDFDKNFGSILFFKRSPNDCWSQDDLSRLQARLIFENIGIPSVPVEKINTEYNANTIRYFKKALNLVESVKNQQNREILQQTLADTIGGNLRSVILPNSKFAYYAGYVPYRSVRNLYLFFDDIKKTLNTEGLGWKPPHKIPLQSNLTVGKIFIGVGKLLSDPCSSLVIKRYNTNCIHIPMPEVDDEKQPAAIALPFKKGGFISLTSPSSENVLLKYYTTAARCILNNSPQECRHSDFVNFNNEMWHWMKRYVAPHLMDERLYAGYGGVLRIAAAVQNYGKGLSRRNRFDNNNYDNWDSPVKSPSFLNRKYNLDFGTNSPLLSSVCLIFLVALTICFLHVFYTWVMGPSGECDCSRLRRNRQMPKETFYAQVDPNFPATESKSHSIRNSEGATKYQSKATSYGTVYNQKVYDLNENVEKEMSFVMSNNTSETSSISSDESDNEMSKKTVVISRAPTPKSPPKIEATVAQLKIEKFSRRIRKRKYSTSIQSQTSRFEQISESGTSDSCTTENSISMDSRARKTKRLRDFAWAKRFMSKYKEKLSSDAECTSTELSTAVTASHK